MPKLLLWPGLCPRPRWGSLQRSPRPPSWIKGGVLLRGGEGREKEGEEGRGSCAPPLFLNFLDPPLVLAVRNVTRCS